MCISSNWVGEWWSAAYAPLGVTGVSKVSEKISSNNNCCLFYSNNKRENKICIID